ncbi:hypothetical protein GCK72_000828 [Caenorhabditis remanei]|uniref:RING-type domain-containing protein n=1 Tax=Caenorhabditis remanei TaxID=31234 RepID=A0A6A5HN44_CAERE|nr:hypothetical protein GCK72_000828 [Caenorhabditis remanei]KAF1769015.1 hypothetical protein GCK72_000828 [Caenorhabditis remanei]
MVVDCGICYDDYDSKDQVPCIGTCGHTICDRCRLSMMSSRCPHCNRKEAFAVKHVNKQLWDLIQFSNFVFGKNEEKSDVEMKQCSECHQPAKRLRICRDCCLNSGAAPKHLEVEEVSESEAKAICEKIRSQALCGDCIIDGEHFRHKTVNVDTFIDSYLAFLRNEK